jgi:sulfatase modifying factor 1
MVVAMVGLCIVAACGGRAELKSERGVGSVIDPYLPSCSSMQDTACSGESCCRRILVPGGTFRMGRGTERCGDCTEGCPSGMSCESQEQPEHPALVSSFALDKFEVTVGRFRAFLNAFADGWRPGEGDGAHAAAESSQGVVRGSTGWLSEYSTALLANQVELGEALGCEHPDQTWTASAGPNEAFPLNCVTWYEALAFCIWDGGRLPTEAELEYAAAGGDENRLYPWGRNLTEPFPANYAANHNTPLQSVGSEPAGNGRWGHADLVGSMREWTLDWHAPDWYATTRSGCSDCVNLTPGGNRVTRGGYWDQSASDLRAARRQPIYPGSRGSGMGFRCAQGGS